MYEMVIVTKEKIVVSQLRSGNLFIDLKMWARTPKARIARLCMVESVDGRVSSLFGDAFTYAFPFGNPYAMNWPIMNDDVSPVAKEDWPAAVAAAKAELARLAAAYEKIRQDK